MKYACWIVLGSLFWVACQPASEKDLLVAWQGNKYGYINADGEFVIRPQFAYALPFGDKDLAAVNVGGSSQNGDFPTNGKWGFINKQGRFVINPQFFPPENSKGHPFDPETLAMALHQGYEFSEGLAAVRMEKEWVYIDEKGKVVIRDARIRSARKFSNGLAAVYMDGGWGYIDTRGEEVIAPMFKFPVEFSENSAFLMMKSGRRVLINTEGEQLFPQYRFQGSFHNGFAPVKAEFKKDGLPESEDLKMGIVDAKGKEKMRAIYDFISSPGDDRRLAPVQIGTEALDLVLMPDAPRPELDIHTHSGGKWGYVDTANQIVINPVYDEAKPFSEGLAPVRRGTVWGYVDTNGQEVIPAQFAWVGPFKNSVARVRMGAAANDYVGRYGYINPQGKVFWLE